MFGAFLSQVRLAFISFLHLITNETQLEFLCTLTGLQLVLDIFFLSFSNILANSCSWFILPEDKSLLSSQSVITQNS